MLENIVEYINKIDSTNIITTYISLVDFNNVLISVLTLNICSIKKHINDLLVLLSSIKNLFDAIVLSETWNFIF